VADFSGLTPGDTYRYTVTANYVNPQNSVPLSVFYSSTVPASGTLAPSLPVPTDLQATPSYADQANFANPQETISWDGVGLTYTQDNETYTLEGYQVTYGISGGSQTSSNVITTNSTTLSATVDVKQGDSYDYSVAAIWSNANGTINGSPQRGSFLANSSLGTPTLTSLGSSEVGASTLQISGSFNTPTEPAQGAAGISAKYQVILTDGSSSYKVFASPVPLDWGTDGVDFSVNSSQSFPFKEGDSVTARVVVTFYNAGNVVGTSSSAPSTITVSNADQQLAGPSNVVFAMSQDLGGTVSWTGPNGASVPEGYSLNGFTVEVVNQSDPSQVYWVDNQVPVNTSGTDYNISVPASISGTFVEGSAYEALVYANYTDTAAASQMTVGASASASMYMPSSSLLALKAPSLSQEYVSGAPALKVSWDSAPSIPTSDNQGSIAPSSYTVYYFSSPSKESGVGIGSWLANAKTMIVSPAPNNGMTSTTLTGLLPGTEYSVVVLAQYPLYGASSGSFTGSATIPASATTYAALPQPSIQSLGFSSTGGALELTVKATTPQATNPSGLSANYSIQVTNQATGVSYTYGPYTNTTDSLTETLQSSKKSLLFGVGQNLNVKVIANYSLGNSSEGTVSSASKQQTVTDSALELPGVSNVAATVVNDQSGNPTMASLSFVAPTGSPTSGWTVAGYDVVATGTNGVPAVNAYFPASGTTGASSSVASSKVVAFNCTKGSCSVLVDGLTAGYTYGVTVMPVYVSGSNEVLGSSARLAGNLTMSESQAVSASVSNIVLAPGYSSSTPSMNVSWEAPTSSSLNGLTVTGYQVQLYQHGTTNVAIGAPQMVTSPSARFTGLAESDSYFVGITTLLKGTDGPVYGPTVYSGSQAESHNHATAPVENVSLKANDTQTGALDISWQVQAGGQYEMPQSFVIKLTEDGRASGATTVAASSVKASTSGDVTTYTDTITGLDPMYVYEATVTPYSGVGGTGVAGISATSPAGATPYSTYVSDASVTNNAPGSVKVSFTGPGSTQYQLEITDALGNSVAGPEQASESGSSYSANFSDLASLEGQTLFAEITPVGSSGQPGPIFIAPFTVYGAPGPVRNLEVTGSGATSVSLGWMAPSTSSQVTSGAVTEYLVSWWLGGSEVGHATTSNPYYTVADLTAGGDYTFQVKAVNGNGFASTPSEIGAIPAAGAVSGPLNLSSEPTTGGLQINWDAPTTTELGGNSLGSSPVYKVTLTNQVTHASQSFDVSTNSYSASGLTDGDPYLVSVQAQVVSADSGDVFWSSPSTVGPDGSTTPAVGPDPVSNLMAYVSSGRAVVSWDSVVDATGYQISINGEAPISTNDSTTYAFPVESGKQYNIEVWATNGLELSAPSEVNEFVASGPVMPKIKEVAPTTVGSPTDPLTSDPSSKSDVTVKFIAPSSIGGAEVRSYTIDLYANDTSGSPQLLATTTLSATQIQQGLNGGFYSYTFNNINNGDVVWANVAANSSTNESTSSQTRRLDVVGVIPAPSQVSALPGNQQIGLSFDAPANLNGGSPQGAEVYWKGPDKLLHSVYVPIANLSPDKTGRFSYAITGLTNGDSYQAWVAWVNQRGQIGQVAQATDTATDSVTLSPYKPFGSSLKFTVSARDVRSGVVDVKFTALPIQYAPQYVIEYTPMGGSMQTLVVPPSTALSKGFLTVPVTGLVNGQLYTFTVVAYAGFVGNSGPGGNLKGSAEATPYGLPGQVVVSSLTGNKKFSMSWSAPTDGGTPITGYKVSVEGDSTSSSTVVHPDSTGGGTFSDSGLVDGQSYTVTISARNAVGLGPSTTLTVIPESGAPVVTGLVVTPTAGNGSVLLSIPAATEGNGTSPITGYQYQYGPTNTGFTSGWITVPVTEADNNPIVTTVNGLTNGTEYSFQVQALSGSVVTSYPTVNATPFAPSPPSTGPITITRTITVVEPSTSPKSSTVPAQVVEPSTSPTPVTRSVSASLPVPYALIGADGGYFNHNAPFDNSLPGEKVSTGAIVGGAPAGSNGYWMVSSNGTVYSFGSAKSFGSVTNLSGKVIGMASTPNGGGYWIATNSGNIYAFGNATNYVGVSRYGVTGLTGSRPLNAPIVGIAALPNGNGLYLVAADGGVFNFGSAHLYGSTYSLGLTGLTGSRPLNAPIVGIAVDPQGTGYLLIAADGGVFNLGSAQFHGSTYSDGITGLSGLHPLNAPIVGGAFAPTVNGKQGYYLFAADGGVFNFGSAPYEGSDASVKLAMPIVGGFVFPS
jgi:hypothetical protein